MGPQIGDYRKVEMPHLKTDHVSTTCSNGNMRIGLDLKPLSCSKSTPRPVHREHRESRAPSRSRDVLRKRPSQLSAWIASRRDGESGNRENTIAPAIDATASAGCHATPKSDLRRRVRG